VRNVQHLPHAWAFATVDEVVSEIDYGFTASATQGEGTRFLRITDIQGGNVDWSTVPTCSINQAELERYRLQPGDLVFARTGATTGKSFLIRTCPRETVFASYLIRLRPSDAVAADYLAYFFQTGSYWKQISEQSTGTAQPGVNSKRLRTIRLPIAPPAQQRDIVAAIESYFSRLDDATATLKRVQRNLDRYRASVLKAAVEGRLVPTEAELAKKEGRSYEHASELLKRILVERRSRWEEAELAKFKAKGKTPTDDKWKAKYKEPVAPDVSELPELPEGWCWATVSQMICEPLANGRSVPTAKKGFPVLRLTAIRDGKVNLSERKTGSWTQETAQKWVVTENDFLVVRGNGSRNIVGRGGLVSSTPNAVAFPDTLIRVRINTAHLEPRLLRLLWDSQGVRNYMQRAAKTTAGIYKINQTDLENLPLPVPPLAEQPRLSDELQRIESVSSVETLRIRTTLQHVVRLRSSILKWAFEGRLVQHEASLPVASD